MATGADIPPELIERILFDVCEDAYKLLDRSKPVPNRKESIKNITACSLTCVYWAQICRSQLFRIVQVKSYEDMRAFLALVGNTPTKFVPISQHISSATLVQRVEDRPWLHLVRMQSSFSALFEAWPSFPCWTSPRTKVRFRIEDSSNIATSSQRSTSQRLFASLPRTLPSSCLQCSHLAIIKPRFVTHRDLTSLLHKFYYCEALNLANVTWYGQPSFESDLLTRDPLNMSLYLPIYVVVLHNSAYTAETAWLAFATIVHRFSRLQIAVPWASGYPGGGRSQTLQILPSAQRAILDTCKSLCQGYRNPTFQLSHCAARRPLAGISPKGIPAFLCYICSIMVREYEPVSDETTAALDEINLSFYGTHMVFPVTDGSHPIIVDHISVLCAGISFTRESSTGGRSSSGLPNSVAYPWAEIGRLCAAQTGFIRLQLQFESHDHLVQFMEAQRAALDKLNGRIALFYWANDWSIRTADFVSLADIGDADAYGHVPMVY